MNKTKATLPQAMSLLEDVFTDFQMWDEEIERALVVKKINPVTLDMLRDPDFRIDWKRQIERHEYLETPPHTSLIDKGTFDDNGKREYREVFANEDLDRVLNACINRKLFERYGDMVHPSCRSYRRGCGCGKVVQDVSRRIVQYSAEVLRETGEEHGSIGYVSDYTKFFDSVEQEDIMNVFDRITNEYEGGVEDPIIWMLKEYYKDGIYLDTADNTVKDAFVVRGECGLSLKQGCAVASFLSDVIMYEVDAVLSEMNIVYYRYSDDSVLIGPDKDKGLEFMRHVAVDVMGMKFNPKKIKPLYDNKWFKFLGFSIKGERLTLHAGRLRTLVDEIRARSINMMRDAEFRNKPATERYDIARRKIYKYLYVGDGEHSWATGVLPIINCKEDLVTINTYIIDCLRAVITGRTHVGGLSFVNNKDARTIIREKGKSVRSNRNDVPVLDDYTTIVCMQNALNTDRGYYEMLVNKLVA